MKIRGRSRIEARRALAGGALAAVIAAAVLVSGSAGESARGGVGPAAGGVAMAAVDSPVAEAARPYVYLRIRGTSLATTVYGGRSWSVFETQTVERWVGDDGSGRQRTKSLAPRFASPEDRRIWEEAGRPRFLAHGFASHVSDELFPSGSSGERPYWTEPPARMPSDPQGLAGWLRDQVNDPSAGHGAGNGFPDSVRTLELVSELLQNPRTTSAQRAALVAAEALVPGVEQLGEARDEIGRRGIAIGARSDNSGAPSVYSLIYDPATSMPLASETETLTPPSALAGTQGWPRVSGTTYLSQGTTFSRRARPRAHRAR